MERCFILSAEHLKKKQSNFVSWNLLSWKHIKQKMSKNVVIFLPIIHLLKFWNTTSWNLSIETRYCKKKKKSHCCFLEEFAVFFSYSISANKNDAYEGKVIAVP